MSPGCGFTDEGTAGLGMDAVCEIRGYCCSLSSFLRGGGDEVVDGIRQVHVHRGVQLYGEAAEEPEKIWVRHQVANEKSVCMFCRA